MKIDVYQKDDFVLFKISGRLVLEECDAFSSVIGSRIAPGLKAVFIALTDVEYLDSAGLGALVDVKVKASENQLRLGILGSRSHHTVRKLDPVPPVRNPLHLIANARHPRAEQHRKLLRQPPRTQTRTKRTPRRKSPQRHQYPLG